MDAATSSAPQRGKKEAFGEKLCENGDEWRKDCKEIHPAVLSGRNESTRVKVVGVGGGEEKVTE